MFKHQIDSINNDIKRTKRAIIALGCSFVQGAGAITENIYRNYSWNPLSPGEVNTAWNLTSDDKKRLLDSYPDVTLSKGTVDFLQHEYNNSFVNVLAKKYFNGDYAAINLGRTGCGNRATIKELHYYPDILWDDIEEHIVIYCPSGLERFDFIDDMWHDPNNHGRWKAMWPNEMTEDSGRAKLWSGYRQHVHSDKYDVLEQISHIQELKLWCKYKNAKLIIVPGFNRFYTKTHFRKSLNVSVERDALGNYISEQKHFIQDSSISNIVDMWPWECMFEPDGCPTFVDAVIKQEFPNTWENEHFWNFKGSGSPELWMTPCAHPSAKGHDLFARLLYKHITEG